MDKLFNCPYKMLTTISINSLLALASVGYLLVWISDFVQFEYETKRRGGLIAGIVPIDPLQNAQEADCSDCEPEDQIQAEIEARTRNRKRIKALNKIALKVQAIKKAADEEKQQQEAKRHQDAAEEEVDHKIHVPINPFAEDLRDSRKAEKDGPEAFGASCCE